MDDEDLIDKRVTTRRAAEIAGMGYEGLRTCLKRGLLKHTGMLLPMVRRGDPAPDLDAKRWSWKEFGIADLCCFRLAKILMDAGIPFEDVRQGHSWETLWQFFCGNDFVTGNVRVRYFLLTKETEPFEHYSECLYTRDQLKADLDNGVLSVNAGHLLVDLVAIRDAVTAAMSEG